MLVYIHVPFCRTRCNYCAFYSMPLGRGVSASQSPAVRDYVDSLFLEMALWGDRLKGKEVHSVFFGGGTPSLLPPDFQAAVLERIDRHFHLAAGAEISMEANPESLLARRAVDAYLAAGINRISMGVQSMDDSFLSLLGRPHRRADVLRAVEHLRAAGCRNLGLDLMWGLPGQSVDNWKAQLAEAAALSPEHLSCYGLTLEEGTPMFQESETLNLPDEDDAAAMYEEGESINAIKAVRSLGINPASGKELFLTRDGKITEEWNYQDKVVVGCTDPKLEGNIGANVMYKNWQLNVLLRYSFGAQQYNQTLADRVEGVTGYENADRRVLDERWQQPGDYSFYKDIADRSVSNATSRFVQDYNYLEMSNISISYRLPREWMKKIGFSSARIGLNTNDLFYVSTVKRERGLDYPFAREFTFSLNLNF